MLHRSLSSFGGIFKSFSADFQVLGVFSSFHVPGYFQDILRPHIRPLVLQRQHQVVLLIKKLNVR